jgi:hypothetical protein
MKPVSSVPDDIFIRIRILGSIHWITDPDPALFASGFQETNKKKFLCLLLTLGTFTECKGGKSKKLK